MRVFLKASGIIANYLGAQPVLVELDNQATLRDLLGHIGKHFAADFPRYLWNSPECRFRGPVVISIDKKVTSDPSTKLEEGQEIQIVKSFVGG